MSIDIQLTGVRPAGEVLAASRRQVEPALREAVATLPPAMCRIAGYHFGWWDADGATTGTVAGGKAIRPALALLAAEAAGGEPAAALPAAVAVELVHNFSLIQDDVIDGDLTRRHRPTVWSVFGTGAAIVGADALLTLAVEVLAASGHASTRPAIQLLNTATLELIEGQAADLSFEDRTDVNLLECLRMAGGKSGALLGCACALGATFGGATAAQVTLLRGFGEQLGVAFQLTDDLLGIWGDPAVTGKPAHSDLQRRKKSLPVVAALTSGTPAGAELAALYHRDRPLSDPELARAAELVERAGGRAWSRTHAGDLLTGALRMLQSAIDLTADTARATAELGALARLAVHRDH
ncbi:MAG: family 2 encapsulin nanocompartment cargo protein polyprenyl transferase [Natronosporangium sp.]